MQDNASYQIHISMTFSLLTASLVVAIKWNN